MQMLQCDPNLRPSADEALNHPWFKEDMHVIKNLLSVNELLVNKSSLKLAGLLANNSAHVVKK